jgi:hypothetical protein
MIHKECIFTLVTLPFYVVYGHSPCLAIPYPVLYIVRYVESKTSILLVYVPLLDACLRRKGC